MAEHDEPFRYLGNDIGELSESDAKPIVYVMTYHSVKGLDFETVFLPRMREGRKPFNEDPELDRRLHFVAMTRSRRNLFLTYSGAAPHPYVKDMPPDALTRMECEFETAEANEDVFVF